MAHENSYPRWQGSWGWITKVLPQVRHSQTYRTHSPINFGNNRAENVVYFGDPDEDLLEVVLASDLHAQFMQAVLPVRHLLLLAGPRASVKTGDGKS
jgi:hypothetical protein